MRSTARLRPRHLALPILATAAFAAPAQAEVAPNRNLEVNHSIEYGLLEGTGYTVGQDVRVDVFRGSTLIATKTGEFAAGRDGAFFEMNHVGGSDCWDGVAPGRTPDIKPGDRFVATILDETTGADTADVDYFFVRDIAFDENPDGTITGHARGQETSPGVFNLARPVDPDVEVMEAKRVAAARSVYTFTGADLNGSGAFANITVGGAPGTGELFIDHLDETGGGSGTTTATRSSDEPELPCGPIATTALSSVSHSVINLANVGTAMVVGGPRLAPATVTGVTFGGTTYAAVNNADTWTATIPASALGALANNAQHMLSVSFSDGAPNETRSILKDVTAPLVTATLDPGTYTGARSVALRSDGSEAVRFTTDGSRPSALSRVYDGTPIVLGVGTHVIRAFSTDAAGNRSDATFTYTILAPVVPPPATPATGAGAAAAQGGGGAALTTAPASSNTGATSRVSLRAFATPPRVKRSRASRYGIRVVMRVASDAKVVRVRIYRSLSNGRRVLVATVFRSPRGAGVNRMSLRDGSVRRKLRIGNYEVEATPGASRTDLGVSSRAKFKVVKG